MKYLIKDCQFGCRYFADGTTYKTKEEIRKQLISYHSIDWEEEKDINTLTLDEILDYGEWEIEKDV